MRPASNFNGDYNYNVFLKQILRRKNPQKNIKKIFKTKTKPKKPATTTPKPPKLECWDCLWDKNFWLN